MFNAIIIVLDLVAIVAALVASWLWLRASANRVRRVSYDEQLTPADMNRIVVSINRSQILNSQAALATAVSAIAVAVRMIIGLITSGP
jgi:uncharacterized SAM-binding protein YcdF (DUF218 family)